MKDSTKLRIIVALTIALLAAGAMLSGCTKPDVREVTVIKEVPVPYHQPCPAAADKPVVPKRVAEEHPSMPAPKDGTMQAALDAANAQVRILAGKVLELFGYADEADGVMTACSKERGSPL